MGDVGTSGSPARFLPSNAVAAAKWRPVGYPDDSPGFPPVAGASPALVVAEEPEGDTQGGRRAYAEGDRAGRGRVDAGSAFR